MAVIIWAVAVVLVSVLAPGAVSDDQARFHDLGADFYDTHAGTEHAKRNHIRQLQALGYRVTLEPAA
jgi:hypothetical protein